jgi:hypothetical protein
MGGACAWPTAFTLVHFLVKLLLSRALLPAAAAAAGRPPAGALSRRLYWRYVVPIGAATALDVALSNAAFKCACRRPRQCRQLPPPPAAARAVARWWCNTPAAGATIARACRRHITVTLYTVVKSSGLIWNFLFSAAAGLVRPSAGLAGAVVGDAAGIVLASVGDTGFDGIGFGLVLGASVVHAARWVMTVRTPQGVVAAVVLACKQLVVGDGDGGGGGNDGGGGVGGGDSDWVVLLGGGGGGVGG